MKLPLELLLCIANALAAPLAPRSATLPHLHGLTPLSHDLSTTNSRHPEKYFHESFYHPHYDGRFAASVLPRPTRAFHMRLLLRSYVHAMRRAGVRTWIMHGSLLGWWWNGSMFPWDSDLDFCVEEGGMHELGSWWNMTVHPFTAAELGLREGTSDPYARHHRTRAGGSTTQHQMDGGEGEDVQKPDDLADGVWTTVLQQGKKYLLEVNPHYTDASTSDKHNVIDARWIDTSTGLFIDITTIHPVPSSIQPSTQHHISLSPGAATPAARSQPPTDMYTKDTHLYSTASLFPLRRSVFEGAPVFVPYAYETLLREEYGPRALTETWYNSYEFQRETREWVVAPDVSSANRPSGGRGRGDREDAAGRFGKVGKHREMMGDKQ
ncbi:mannosyltransferase [Ascochyta rabiei]|uniref:LicD/FKTN/FKRP nucleotidyltransferase domain-containing protein n=1 Tax=Didymella rabiei TaxID=5454 RepID=A0A163GL08_DIDRA|nr:mannosyltransferase [Ascochyta rabiei]KZM24902.1 hypothetical protein ST47_g3917 [Ascochyta rabiei]UPX12093.1 mannosyltransferase [Ascochyta rabiei]